MIASNRSKNSLFRPLRGATTNQGFTLTRLLAMLLATLPIGAARADTIFVANFIGPRGTIGEYTTAGATVNAALVLGLNGPKGLAVSGSNLFVASEGSGTIGEYTTAGATVNAALVSGLNTPQGLAVSGSDLFVANLLSNTIGEYTTAGATVNAALVTGLKGPGGVAVSGSDLFVANSNLGTIGEYTTAGATVNAALISTFNTVEGIAVSGSDLFVANFADGTIGEYTTAGATVNAALVTGLGDIGPTYLAVTASPSVPEPSTWAMLLLGFAGLGLAGYRRARAGHTPLAA
jgi:hypothetical protein